MRKLAIQWLLTIILCLGLKPALADGDLHKSPPLHLSKATSSLDIIVDRRIINFSDSDPATSLPVRLDNLLALLNTYFLDHPHEPEYYFTFGLYPELNAKMAAIASCSKQWDFKTGTLKTHSTNKWLLEQLNTEPAYPELLPVFAAIGYQIHLATIESINLCAAKKIDWTNLPPACDATLPPKAQLPCGALLTFKLKLK